MTIVETAALSHTGRFDLVHGGRITGGRVAFRVDGPTDAPVALVLGGISADRNVTDGCAGQGWWRHVVGPAGPLDTQRWRVLGIDYLGGNGGSSRVAAGHSVDTVDQARAVAAVLDTLGVGRVAMAVGASYGGMVALAFAVRFPERVGRLLVMSAAHRPDPMATALRSLQRRVVRLGRRCAQTREGLVIARGLAMTTYRTAAEFAERFPGPGRRRSGRFRFPVEDYLQRCGERFADGWTADAFLALSESIDLHAIDPTVLRTPATLVGVAGDAIVPDELFDELVSSYGGPIHRVDIESVYGHDAFLKETTAVGAVVREVAEVVHV